jgi:phage terminase small subunit
MSNKNENGLTPLQEVFAQTMVIGNVSQSDAYRHAYPKSATWKPDTVHQAASRLMSHSKIRARIAFLQKKSAETVGLEASKVLEEVRRLAHSDIAGIMTADGKVKLPHELDPVTRAAVASFKIDEYGRIEYKFWPKNDALDKAMKHLGLYEKDNAQQPAAVTRIELVELQKDSPTN